MKIECIVNRTGSYSLYEYCRIGGFRFFQAKSFGVYFIKCLRGTSGLVIIFML